MPISNINLIGYIAAFVLIWIGAEFGLRRLAAAGTRSLRTSTIRRWASIRYDNGCRGGRVGGSVSLAFYLLVLCSNLCYSARLYQPVFVDPMTESWRWRTFPNLSGLYVQCMEEEANGTIWFGTGNGLWRYDGVEWDSLASNDTLGRTVTTIYSHTDGSLYVGGDWGISQLRKGNWTRLLSNTGNRFGDIRKIITGPGGWPWAAMSLGILRQVESGWILYTDSNNAERLRQELRLPFLKVELLPKTVGARFRSGGSFPFIGCGITDACADRHGRLWFGTGGGEILCYTPAQAVVNDNPVAAHDDWTVYNKSDGIVSGVITSILPAHDGTIWIVHAPSEQANVFDGRAWKTIRLPLFLPALDLGDEGGKLIQTQDSVIWLAARYTLFTYRDGNWRKYEYTEFPHPSTRNVVMQSADGALWFADPDDYIRRLDYQTPRWLTLEDLNFYWESPAGVQWFLHRNGRVVVHEGDRWTSYGIEDDLIDMPVALLGTRSGDVWVAGSHKGAAATARFDGAKWTPQLHDDFSCGIDWRGVFESSDGSVWFGAFVYTDDPKKRSNGILQFRDGVWTHHYQPGRSPRADEAENPATLLPPSRRSTHPIEKFVCLGESRDGRIWAGRDILAYYDENTWEEFTPTPEIQPGIIEAMLTTPEGELWIGSRQYGVLNYDGYDWQRFQGRGSLEANSIRSLAQTTDGSIWAATDRGFSRFDGRSWVPDVLPEELNLRHEGGSLKASPSGRLWINRYHVDWYRRFWERAKPVAPDADFRTVCHQFRGKPPDTTITLGEEIVPQPGNIAILWSGVASWRGTKDSRLQFSFHLDDGPWSAYTSDSSHSFFSLPSGRHHVEVRARDNDFNVDPTPATLDFMVLPPVWRQSWFILLMVAAAGAIITLTVRVWLERGQLRELNLKLDQRVRERTAELEAANKELEAFAYSVSHDLRAPLRHVAGFLELLEKRIASDLDEKGHHYMTAVMDSADRMGVLIDELLSFSRMGRQEIVKTQVDLNSLVQEVIRELGPDTQGRDIRWKVGNLPKVRGDYAMLKIVLVNLLSNAVKFTQSRPVAEIEIDWLPDCANEITLFVRDNGVGFDMAYAGKLFGVFQRLHGREDFEGTGIGLANVRRIISRHGGRTWAEGKIGRGATFFFALPRLT